MASKQTVSELCGESVYLFLNPQTPLLAIVAAATVLGQMYLLYIFWWASQEHNQDGDYAYEFEATCDENGNLTCSAMNPIGLLGVLGSLILVFLGTAPDLINGGKLLCRRSFGSGLAMMVTAFLGGYVTLLYLGATVHGDTNALKDAVLILMVNELDEQVYTNLLAIAPMHTLEKTKLLDSEVDEPAWPQDGAAPTKDAASDDKSQVATAA